MNKLQRYRDKKSSIGCVICREYFGERSLACLHHVAEGSGKRSEYMIVPLCFEHHQGKTGFHNNPKGFLRQYKLATEYHLLGLTNKYLAEDL